MSKIMRQGGFTLAELLVSIGIMVLFLAILLPGFSSFGRRNELAQAAQLVQSKILEAKGYALAPRIGGGVGIAQYQFIAPALTVSGCTGSDRYAILELAGNPTVSTLVACDVMPNGIIFLNAQQTITFDVVAQGAITPQGSDIQFQIQHPRLTSTPNTRTITVRTSTAQVTISTP